MRKTAQTKQYHKKSLVAGVFVVVREKNEVTRVTENGVSAFFRND